MLQCCWFLSPTPTNVSLLQFSANLSSPSLLCCLLLVSYTYLGHHTSCAALLGILEFDGASKRSKPNLKVRKGPPVVQLGLCRALPAESKNEDTPQHDLPLRFVPLY